MKKLHLLEDIEEVVQEEPKITDLGISSLLSSMIKSEWDSVDLFSSILATLEEEDCDQDILTIVSDIVSNHYIHIGQLERALQLVNDHVDNIEDGKELATDQID